MVYFLDKYMHSKRQTLSVYDSSEGTLFLLFVAVLLAHDDSPTIFALDNVDNALNPRMTRVLLETIIGITKESSEKGLICGPRQVFLTSHNPTSLDAFDLFRRGPEGLRGREERGRPHDRDAPQAEAGDVEGRLGASDEQPQSVSALAGWRDQGRPRPRSAVVVRIGIVCEGPTDKAEAHPFWETPGLKELARSQSVQPMTDVEPLFGTWPGEEDDGFELAIDQLRHPSRKNERERR